MEAGYSCFAELGGELGVLGVLGEPACQQLGGFSDHLDLLSHEVLEAEAEDEDEDDRLISLDSGDSSSRQLQGGSQQGQLLPHRKTSRKQDTTVRWVAIVEGTTREVFDAKLAATVVVEIAPATSWGHGTWKPSASSFSSVGLRRRELRCPFRGSANACCDAVLRETVDEHGRWTLERKCGVPHADHNFSNKRRGLSKFIKLTVVKPASQVTSTLTQL